MYWFVTSARVLVTIAKSGVLDRGKFENGPSWKSQLPTPDTS